MQALGNSLYSTLKPGRLQGLKPTMNHPLFTSRKPLIRKNFSQPGMSRSHPTGKPCRKQTKKPHTKHPGKPSKKHQEKPSKQQTPPRHALHACVSVCVNVCAGVWVGCLGFLLCGNLRGACLCFLHNGNFKPRCLGFLHRGGFGLWFSSCYCGVLV